MHRWQPTHFEPSSLGKGFTSSKAIAWCPPSLQERKHRPQERHLSLWKTGKSTVSRSMALVSTMLSVALPINSFRFLIFRVPIKYLSPEIKSSIILYPYSIIAVVICRLPAPNDKNSAASFHV